MAWLPTLLVLLAAPAIASGEPPADIQEIALRRHKDAVRLHGQGKLKEAIESWAEAETLHPTWKYAFNLGSALADAGSWLGAWAALDRAAARGVPEEHREAEKGIRERVRLALLRTHARLVLLAPEGARVTRNGEPWLPPWSLWTTEPRSVIVVDAAGSPPETKAVEHAPGSEPVVRVELAEATGALVVTGLPEGAVVEVDGKPAGQLPRCELSAVAAGRHTVLVRAGEGGAPVMREVDVEPGRTTTVEVDATPAELGTAKSAASKRTLRRRWGWGLLIGGSVTVVLGLTLWSQADNIAQKWEEDAALYRAAGGAVMGVGGLAAATGGILFLTAREPSGPEASFAPAPVAPMPIEGGGGLVGTACF